MLNRVVFENSTAIYTIVAFAVAATIFLVISYKAIRMDRSQTDKFSDLPFSTPTPPAQNGPTQST